MGNCNGEKSRCAWLNDDPLYIEYHDSEWGVPLYDDQALFECLLLEGAQAGLSWYIILKKRETYRKAFAGFNPNTMAGFRQARIERLLDNPGIVRHRGKVEAFINNARVYLDMCAAGIVWNEYLWGFVDGCPQNNHWNDISRIPVKTPASEAMSRDLKKRGFKFVGATTCYAFMQAVGMVNDHVIDCYRHSEIQALNGSST